ncbi:MAG: hypothetical protein EOP11_17910 [Proteobacteria bacterium]|nr:MAG: hypothetical protein EOP11_17910 [Pseudomonadota bacterium]
MIYCFRKQVAIEVKNLPADSDKWSMKAFLALALLASLPAHAEPVNYCLAIRGNGESVAAHWPAMARLVEENGLPEATAGGSSASISMFFLDSLAGNEKVKQIASEEKRRRAYGLLLKSIPEFVAEMARQDRLVDAFAFMGELRKKDSPTVERALQAFGAGQTFSSADMSRVFQKYAPLVNPDLAKGLSSSPDFFRGEARNAVKVFGQFDARTDKNLFVRPGLLDFKYFALIVGTVADFYAGNTDEATANALSAFTEECATASFRTAWEDLPAGSCRAKFTTVARNYLARGKFTNQALFTRAGQNLKSFPSTAVLKGNAAAQFRKMREAYYAGNRQEDYAGFSVKKEEELGFGYWGQPSALKAMQRELRSAASAGDEKAKRFTALNSGNWFEVLSTSPAEPGLASLQEIPINTSRELVMAALNRPLAERWDKLEYRQDMVSAGGWSDLHPTGVLRAAGCEHVVYLTRKDGDAIFGQQVFIRLTGSTKLLPFWENLSERNNEGWKVEGAAAASAWNQLYNLGNPESSFHRSLGQAEAVYCTDWNRFKPFNGEMDSMLKDAYRAPVFLRSGGDKRLQVNPAGQASEAPGCL